LGSLVLAATKCRSQAREAGCFSCYLPIGVLGRLHVAAAGLDPLLSPQRVKIQAARLLANGPGHVLRMPLPQLPDRHRDAGNHRGQGGTAPPAALHDGQKARPDCPAK
jgi:hypothetical protein